MAAIFLDRDGVINRKAPEGRYISKWEEVRFLPAVFASVGTLHRAGFKIIVVTNQRGVALGEVRIEDLKEIHRRMKAKFDERGAVLTDIYFCPHNVSEQCSCRKPRPGMLLQAAEEHALDLSSCWMIGDAESDVEAGKNVGCKTIRIIQGGSTAERESQADMLARDLGSAALKILRSVRVIS